MNPAFADVSEGVPRVPGLSKWRFALTLALLLLALAGTAIAGYLAWENSQGKTGVCTVVHGCATVQESKYGKVLGIPISVPGLGLYLVLVAAAVVVLVDFRGWRAVRDAARVLRRVLRPGVLGFPHLPRSVRHRCVVYLLHSFCLADDRAHPGVGRQPRDHVPRTPARLTNRLLGRRR